jgi:hypothetical protein
MATLGQEFAGVDGATIFGSSRFFEPGRGRVRLGLCKINHGQKKVFIQECKIVWYRGGAELDGTRLPDSTFKPGDDLAYIVNFNWQGKDSHFKMWGLAVMQATAIKRGLDPSTVTADQILGSTCAQIMATQMQDGLEVDFTAIVQKRKDGGSFTKVAFQGGTQEQPGPMAATPPPALTPAGATAALRNQGQPDPFATIDPKCAPPAAAPPDPFEALRSQAAPPATPPPDPFAALQTQAQPAALPAPTRDQKIAKLRSDPRFANYDLSRVDDATIDRAYQALP